MYSRNRSTFDGDGPSKETEQNRPRICDVDGALARLGGDRILLSELMHIYLEDAPMLLVRIQRGVRDSNCWDVLHAAHLLRGLAANLGAGGVTEPAQRLEEIAIEGRLEQAATTVEQLHTEAVRLEKALQNICCIHRSRSLSDLR